MKGCCFAFCTLLVMHLLFVELLLSLEGSLLSTPFLDPLAHLCAFLSLTFFCLAESVLDRDQLLLNGRDFVLRRIRGLLRH